VLVGIAVVLPICLLGFDLVSLIIGFLINSSVCREAARAASIGAPNAIEKGGPQRRAQEALDKAQIPRSFIAVSLDKVEEQVKIAPDADVFGGAIDGQVTVRTKADITPPFFLSSFMGHRNIEFVGSQTYPYTYTVTPGQTQAKSYSLERSTPISPSLEVKTY
jgi:hypothetical protein